MAELKRWTHFWSPLTYECKRDPDGIWVKHDAALTAMEKAREEERVKVLGEVQDALTCGPLRDEFADALGKIIGDKHAALKSFDQLSATTPPDGGLEQREYRVNTWHGIFGPFPDQQAALAELGEHQADWDDNGGPRPPALESRIVGPWGFGHWDAATRHSSLVDEEGER